MKKLSIAHHWEVLQLVGKPEYSRAWFITMAINMGIVFLVLKYELILVLALAAVYGLLSLSADVMLIVLVLIELRRLKKQNDVAEEDADKHTMTNTSEYDGEF